MIPLPVVFFGEEILYSPLGALLLDTLDISRPPGVFLRLIWPSNLFFIGISLFHGDRRMFDILRINAALILGNKLTGVNYGL